MKQDSAQDIILSLRGIGKNYGGVQALNGVDLELRRGEIHCVVGENGAGKSTLMKIIAGLEQATAGEYLFEGKRVALQSPKEASDLGVALVPQELSCFEDLSVLENIFLNHEITRWGIIQWDLMAEEALKLFDRIGLSKDILAKLMGDLSLGTKQMLMIAQGLHRHAPLIIFDEPTSILSYEEGQKLLRLIEDLKEEGVSILYISHRLEEVLSFADRITLLRDGELVACYPAAAMDVEKLITAISGRAVDRNIYRSRDYEKNDALLEVENLSSEGFFHNISFKIRHQEVLGLYGLIGAGCSELARTVLGDYPYQEGQITYKAQPYHPKGISSSIANKIVYLPEDRKSQGIFPLRSIGDNLSSGFLEKISKRGIVEEKEELALIKGAVTRFSIRIGKITDYITTLSGGNQQKVLFGRSLSHNPDLLILDEPTRGIDIQTKVEIHKMIMDYAEKGMAILLVSSDISELMALADNFIVLHEGEFMGLLGRAEASEEQILSLALGCKDRALNYTGETVHP